MTPALKNMYRFLLRGGVEVYPYSHCRFAIDLCNHIGKYANWVEIDLNER